MKENEKRPSNVRITSDVELQPEKRDRKASRNSWTNIYSETTALRTHKKLLGQEIELDAELEWRVKWAQRGAGVFSLLAFICWLARQHIPTILFSGLVLIFGCMLYYTNVSLVIAKLLLREIHVVVILVLALCNWSIDIVQPARSLSPILSFVYVLIISTFVFLDAVKVKNRLFVMVVGLTFVLSNINNIYQQIFTDWDQGVVLFKYTIQENEYTVMKRSTKLSIYIQIMLFSMSGIYTIFKDRKQELMIFATGHIYRETGTASKDVEQKSFVRKMKSEKKILSV